jgi:dTDP-glucose pyrophosphorylase
MIVVMPMAGRGSRFSNKGYQTPKPLIQVDGIPMFVRALGSIGDLIYEQLVIIALKEHEETYRISDLIDKYLPSKPVKLILIEEVTDGQLCTVLLASEQFKHKPVLVMASDTLVDGNIDSDIRNIGDAKGLISVINLPGDGWSFARTNEEGIVLEVQEKIRISDHASTGLYFFSSGDELIYFGNEMIQNNERTRGEFFVIPVYQKLIQAGFPIKISKAKNMWDMGTPESLNRFIEHLRNEA